jgi:hypothetical protein
VNDGLAEGMNLQSISLTPISALLSIVVSTIMIMSSPVYGQELQMMDVYVEGYNVNHDYDVCGGSPTDKNRYSCISFRGTEFEDFKGTFEYDFKRGDRIFACVFDTTGGGYSCQYDTESSPTSVESFLIDMRRNDVLSTGLPEVLRNEDPRALFTAQSPTQVNPINKCVMLVMCIQE